MAQSLPLPVDVSDTSVFKSAFDYIVTDFWEINGDSFAKHLPLIESGPWRIFGIILVYLSFVKIWGPYLMRNREPFELRNVIFYYDIGHVVGNGFCSLFAIWLTRGTFDTWGCKMTDPTNPWDHTYLVLGYLYFICKFVDLLDTVFFVLRKKDRQITTLHVIHHGIMPFTAYIALKFAPVGRTAFVGIINSAIHTVMYAYYAFAAMGPAMQPYLWWKKYITKMQMVQFVLIIAHSIQGSFFLSCSFPWGISVLEFIHGLFFLNSFYAFFKSEYITSKRDTKKSID